METTESLRLVARRVFRGCLAYTAAITVAWLGTLAFAPPDAVFFRQYRPDRQSLVNVAIGFLFFNILWGWIW